MDRIVYPFRRTFLHTLYILAGIMGLAVGLPFYCGCLPLGWMMAAALQEDQFFLQRKRRCVALVRDVRHVRHRLIDRSAEHLHYRPGRCAP